MRCIECRFEVYGCLQWTSAGSLVKFEEAVSVHRFEERFLARIPVILKINQINDTSFAERVSLVSGSTRISFKKKKKAYSVCKLV